MKHLQSILDMKHAIHHWLKQTQFLSPMAGVSNSSGQVVQIRPMAVYPPSLPVGSSGTHSGTHTICSACPGWSRTAPYVAGGGRGGTPRCSMDPRSAGMGTTCSLDPGMGTPCSSCAGPCTWGQSSASCHMVCGSAHTQGQYQGPDAWALRDRSLTSLPFGISELSLKSANVWPQQQTGITDRIHCWRLSKILIWSYLRISQSLISLFSHHTYGVGTF